MSFKDDFLEALRSVKRDFFNGSGAEDQAYGVSPEKGSRQAPDLNESDGFVMPGDIVVDAASDMDVMDAFNRASSLGESAMDVDDEAGEADELHKPSPDSVPLFRGLDGAGIFPDTSDMPVSNDARKIYDFDPGDLYSDNKTIISRNTVIRGALQTDDSVRLLGQIMGDIDCKSNIVVAGKVRGNTTAANAYVIDAQIDGNMLCDDTINVNKDAWVLGNIRAQQAEIDGKIKGNIEIRHAVSIGSASSVIGNISTDELEIKRGAFINGQIIMYSPSRDVLDRFEDFDRQ